VDRDKSFRREHSEEQSIRWNVHTENGHFVQVFSMNIIVRRGEATSNLRSTDLTWVCTFTVDGIGQRMESIGSYVSQS
jgi:hypothetical protein